MKGFVGRLCEPSFPTFSPVHFQAPGLFTYHRSVAHLRDKDGNRVKGPVSLESVKELGFAAVEAGEGGPILITGLYITPVAPGRSRLTTLEGSNLPAKGLMGWIRHTRWISHLFLQQVLDGEPQPQPQPLGGFHSPMAAGSRTSSCSSCSTVSPSPDLCSRTLLSLPSRPSMACAC